MKRIEICILHEIYREYSDSLYGAKMHESLKITLSEIKPKREIKKNSKV